MTPEAKVIDAAGRLKSERSSLNQLWQEIAEVLAPSRAGFTSSLTTDDIQRGDKIFDTTPIIAKRGLVNAIGAMLRPKSSAPGKWFDIVPENEAKLEKRENKEFIEFAEDRFWRSIYNPKANFIASTGEIDDDIVTFGSGCGFVGLNRARNGLLFKSFHMKDCYFEVDADNNVIGVYVFRTMTSKQAAAAWGEERLGAKTREDLKKPDKPGEGKFDFVWVVRKRFEFDRRIDTNLNMPNASRVVDIESEHTVLEEGFEEMPFFTPRWDTRSGEIYGRGPGVLALPDVLTLNAMGKTMLRALHRAVSPPLLLPSDSIVNAPQLFGDGITYYDAEALSNLGLSDPFRQLDSRANIPWGLDAQDKMRETIFALFFRNILHLPTDGPDMTATEVIQRREEFIREIGAVFGRLETDYTGPMVERAFNIMLRSPAQPFGPPENIPEDLQGEDLTFRFASPVEKAKRQIEEATITQAVDKVLAIGERQPEVMDPFDWTGIGSFIGESNDFPPELMLEKKAVEDKQEARRQEQTGELALQGVERAAGVAGALPDRILDTAIQQQGGAPA